MKDKVIEEILGLYDLGLIREEDFYLSFKEKIFYDIEYNIIAQPYFTNKFELWKPFLYDMVIF